MRFIDCRPSVTDYQVKEILEKYITMQREHGIQYWPIFLLTSGEHAGCCGLRPYDVANRVYELGVHIRPTWWRHGLAEEATPAVIGYAFNTLRASALFAGHNPDNMASQSLLQKLGFHYTHDQYYPATGLKHPSYILRHDTSLSIDELCAPTRLRRAPL